MSDDDWEPWGQYPAPRPAVPEVGMIVCSEDQIPRRVLSVSDSPYAGWSPGSLAKFAESGIADPEDWGLRPRRVGLEVASRLIDEDGTHWVVYPWTSSTAWWLLLDVWMECSACHKVMSCNCYAIEWHVARAATQMREFGDQPPGSCWNCDQQIGDSPSVTYPGDNLLMIGYQAPQFHVAVAICMTAATIYEELWQSRHPGDKPVLSKNALKRIVEDRDV